MIPVNMDVIFAASLPTACAGGSCTCLRHLHRRAAGVFGGLGSLGCGCDGIHRGGGGGCKGKGVVISQVCSAFGGGQRSIQVTHVVGAVVPLHKLCQLQQACLRRGAPCAYDMRLIAGQCNADQDGHNGQGDHQFNQGETFWVWCARFQG